MKWNSFSELIRGQIKKYICCFRRVTNAINRIYKLISFLNYYYSESTNQCCNSLEWTTKSFHSVGPTEVYIS